MKTKLIIMGLFFGLVLQGQNQLSNIQRISGEINIGTPATNYTQIENDGTIELIGTATVFDDLQFGAIQLGKTGQANKPDFDNAELGLLFPDNDTTENTGLIGQELHSYKEGSTIYPHIHVIQTGSDTAIFKMKYRIYNIGSNVPAWTYITTNAHTSTWSSGNLHQVLKFPGITMSGKTISCLIDIVIWRSPTDAITGDVLVKTFDIHTEIDGLGSRTEYTK
jgi:hypothetical protein